MLLNFGQEKILEIRFSGRSNIRFSLLSQVFKSFLLVPNFYIYIWYCIWSATSANLQQHKTLQYLWWFSFLSQIVYSAKPQTRTFCYQRSWVLFLKYLHCTMTLHKHFYVMKPRWDVWVATDRWLLPWNCHQNHSNVLKLHPFLHLFVCFVGPSKEEWRKECLLISFDFFTSIHKNC